MNRKKYNYTTIKILFLLFFYKKKINNIFAESKVNYFSFLILSSVLFFGNKSFFSQYKVAKILSTSVQRVNYTINYLKTLNFIEKKGSHLDVTFKGKRFFLEVNKSIFRIENAITNEIDESDLDCVSLIDNLIEIIIKIKSIP